MAGEAQGSDCCEPVVEYQLWQCPEVEGRRRWFYGTHPEWNNGRNAEICQPFPDEPRFFVSFGRHRGWINGGLMDAMALAISYLEGKSDGR